MKFSELKEEYQSISDGCCKCGKVYSFRDDILKPVFCKEWVCERCRKKLKNDLYINTVHNVLLWDLDRHFVITSKGKDFRSKYSYIDSFEIISYEWKKLKQMIERKYGFISYIVFPRAQKSGYAHLHILLDSFVDWNFLEEKRKGLNLGYLSIQKNRSVADYLHRDFFKDHEYYIPKGKKHYYCSRNIMMRNFVQDEFWKDENIYFRTNDKEFIYNVVNDRFGYPLPFDEYVKDFIDLVKKKDV